MYSDMCTQRRLRSVYACTQSNQSICCPFYGDFLHSKGRLLYQNCFASLLQKGLHLKENKLLPRGANSFHLNRSLFKRGWCPGKETGHHNSCFPCKMAENNQAFPVPLTCLHYFSRRSTRDIFVFYPENRIRHFMQIVSIGDNLHDMSNPVFWEK